MTGNSKRSIRLLSWRTLRWVVTLPALPLVWWACTSHPLAQPDPAPEQQTNIYITVKPNRMLDLVFMVDNSPSMAPKQKKMNDQFPKLIEALRDPTDQTLPDLRVAIIDSDLGTGGAYPNGSCGPKTLPDGTVSNYGDLGKFQMIGATKCGVKSSDALFLEYKDNAPVNFTGNINDVFACLAGNLGTLGCGEEHQLQAFEFALAAKKIGNDGQQDAFLRPAAYLGLVFLSDEDDCSAATNDGMFGQRPGGTSGPDLSAESASLRCYTRSHTCSGVGNLNDNGPGYPTKSAFKTSLTNCSARTTDSCPNPIDNGNASEVTDTSKPTGCSPLRNIKNLADHIKGVKTSADQILVAGIYGWPLTDADMATAEYKIDQVPNPTADPNHPTVYDSWPICYDPAHPAPKDGSFSNDAAGNGATAGLRMTAFIKEFGDANGLSFSICQADFSASMKKIGDALRNKLTNLCVDYKLYDTDTNKPGLQSSCRVVYRTPKEDPADKNKIAWDENPSSLPECQAGDTSATVAVDHDCWRLTQAPDKCQATGQLIEVVRSKDAPALPAGTQVGMQCRTCTDFSERTDISQDSEVYKACHY
jgi:hypothetical protein